ncbi:MAG: MBL fold metallo-hydrolase [Hamadaea sp.]|nr:MBL fold metallo-hydrolase [Hamadaea sp.]
MRISWLGHSTVLIEVSGVRILTDPLLRRRFAGLRWAVPRPAVTRNLFRGNLRVDAVLLSHLHHDHCDLPSLRLLGAPAVVAPSGAGRWLRRRRIGGVVETAVGATVSVGEASVTAVHAEHHGRREPSGPWAQTVGHLIDTPDAAVWLAGDTAPHPSFRDLARSTRRGRLDLAVVPVWGWGPRLGPGHLDPRTAAEAAVQSGAAHAIPVHWGTLYPAGLLPLMRTRLVSPGPEFARHLAGTGVEAHVLPVGGRLLL